MISQRLSPQGEQLLDEIIELKNSDENESTHWIKRFESLSFDEDSILRDTFRELKGGGYIKVFWADDIPYLLTLTLDGINYFERKKRATDVSDLTTIEKSRKQYDVFISHASKDKLDYVNELYITLQRLGISIFYDSVEISWGDNWKRVILEGAQRSEFAIIVISEKFFNREWTEKELNEFLRLQNESGQKIILPLLHNITLDVLKGHYPDLSDIQCIESKNYSLEGITILLAKELIKRFR